MASGQKENVKMTRTSEWVSGGHPDKVADFIVSWLLDRYLERDENVRFAVECQVKDSHVTLGGEVTSAAVITDDEIRRHVRDAVCAIGYTPDYVRRWGADNCIDPDSLDVTIHIGQQSPDIAQGVNRDGWGDQGIFWGMATVDTRDMMPLDHGLAKRIGMELYRTAQADGGATIGLDIKTQVKVVDGRVAEVVAAVPTRDPSEAERMVRRIVQREIRDAVKMTVNGTGSYVRHATAGDCGTTGRKLAVDFYGGNCFIGGGCPWGKDPSKADVTLNVYARHLAVEMLGKGVSDTVFCALDCCIGRREIGISYFDGGFRELMRTRMDAPASQIVDMMRLKRPVWASRCELGLFTEIG